LFWVKNCLTPAALWRGHYRATRKNLESRMQLDEATECPSGGGSLLIYKIRQLFIFLVQILCSLQQKKKKKLST
jgi:hypothetical protein